MTGPTDYHDFCYYDMPIKRRREFDIGDIFENTIECKLCGYIIRSKNRHDYRKCKCGAVAIDGGSWYSKWTGDLKNIISHVRLFKYRSRK